MTLYKFDIKWLNEAFKQAIMIRKNAKYAIVYTVDERLVPAVCCAICRTRAMANEDCDIYLILVDTTERVEQQVITFFDNRNLSIIIENLTGVIDIDERFPRGNRFGDALYLRLYLDELITGDYEKVLCLDADTFVERPIIDLLSTDMKGKAVAAVDDLHPYVTGLSELVQRRVGLAADAIYFNAGVLMYSWREALDQAVFPKTRQCLVNNKEQFREFPDQDALNYVLRNSRFRLDPRWNVQDFYFHHGKQFKPWIIHFTGRRKPWGPDHPKFWTIYAEEYAHVLADSPWPGFVRRPGFKNQIANAARRHTRSIEHFFVFAVSRIFPGLFRETQIVRAKSWKTLDSKQTDDAMQTLIELAASPE